MLKKLMEKKKREQAKRNRINSAKGLAAGAALGALAGVLLAPKSGKDTREEIVNSAKDLNENVKVKAKDAKEVVTSKTKEAKCKISDYLNKKKEGTSEVCEEVETTNEAEEVLEKVKDNE
ncbi:YtxH domain-containing protein [Clostridium sp.]|uniref:YtxH domain-containing protein n=1 Tax=Clostridium sp. TaxID=1506 RepID=UPI003463FC97